jgi:hypothetical protein
MYSYKKTAVKGIKSFVVILVSLIIAGLEAEYPNVWNFALGSSTIGAVLFMFLNWLKVKMGVKIP